MTNKIFQIVAKISIASLFLAMIFQFNILPVNAAALTGMSDTFERLKINSNSNQTIQFTSTSGVVNGDMIEVQWPVGEFSGWGVGGLGEDDVEIYNVTAAHTYTDAADCSGTDEVYVNVGVDLIRLFFCVGDGGSVTAGDVIKIYIGSFTTETVEDGNFKLANPAVAGTKIISLYTGPFGMGMTLPDNGKLAVDIISDDRVEITASVDATLSFDIDTTTVAMPGTETAAPYTVAFGSLNPAIVNTSNNSSINSIYLDFATSAAFGGTITVQDSNTGLTSSTVGYTVASASALLSPGTEGYGICYSSQSNFDTTYPTYATGNCTPTKHTVGALQTTPQSLIGSTVPFVSGRVEVLVKTAISSLTPAANDYTDTITFIATGTF